MPDPEAVWLGAKLLENYEGGKQLRIQYDDGKVSVPISVTEQSIDFQCSSNARMYKSLANIQFLFRQLCGIMMQFEMLRSKHNPNKFSFWQSVNSL